MISIQDDLQKKLNCLYMLFIDNLVRVYLEKSSETRVTVFILANDVRVM